jgi:signal transduction histidine kinase
MNTSQFRVLLIEDDEDDYVLVRDMLSSISQEGFVLDWVNTYDAALQTISSNSHDVYLLDYRLGERNGLQLVREFARRGCTAPIIFMTGHGDYRVDLEAMKAGVADYLVKDQISPHILERSIRYAIERNRTERELKSLSSRLLKAQEEERRRIAREMHDSIGAALSAAKFSAENALAQLDQGKVDQTLLKGVVSVIQNAIDESRRIMTDLRPSMLDDLGIITTINWFCRQYRTIYSNIDIEKKIEVEEEDIPEELKITIFRIVQEAFHNIAKYSKAELVELSLLKTDHSLDLIVQDNGVGFDLNSILSRESHVGRFGLLNMKERAKLSGGTFEIVSAPRRGTTIRASWSL